jgi:hypothetical protein
MNEEEVERLKQNLIIAQYNRASYDYRFFVQSTWQIPSVAITITSVFFEYHLVLLRIIIL